MCHACGGRFQRGGIVAVERLTETELMALPVTVDVVTAGKAWGVAKNKVYGLIRAGKFPCEVLPLGERLVVTKTALLRSLGYEVAPAPSRESAA
jgi:hypothetical protein